MRAQFEFVEEDDNSHDISRGVLTTLSTHLLT